MGKILLLTLLMTTIVAASIFGDRGTTTKLAAFFRKASPQWKNTALAPDGDETLSDA